MPVLLKTNLCGTNFLEFRDIWSTWRKSILKDALLNTIAHKYICCDTDLVLKIVFRFQTFERVTYDSQEIAQFKYQS